MNIGEVISAIIYFIVSIYVFNRFSYNLLIEDGRIGEALLTHPYLTLRYGKVIKI